MAPLYQNYCGQWSGYLQKVFVAFLARVNVGRQYVISQFYAITQHFLPPLMINTVLGTILWTNYSLASSALSRRIDEPIVVSALAGAFAGGTQAIAAAPAENVRILLEGGAEHAKWSTAWKEVFRAESPLVTPNETRSEARKVRQWMSEVRGMAGRGWDGWRWTLAKDSCGCVIFFSSHARA